MLKEIKAKFPIDALTLHSVFSVVALMPKQVIIPGYKFNYLLGQKPGLTA